MIDYQIYTGVTRSRIVITIISKTNSTSIALLKKQKIMKKRQFTTLNFLEFFSMYPLKSISNYSKSNDMKEK